MSNYRDDSNDTAVMSDASWVGLTAVADDGAFANETLVFRLRVLLQDSFYINDQVTDSQSIILVDQVAVSDAAGGSVDARMLAVDSFAIADKFYGGIQVLHQDSANVSDFVIENTILLSVDSAQSSDEVVGSRQVVTVFADTVGISDVAGQFRNDLVEDFSGVKDSSSGTVRSVVLLVDGADLSDEVVDGHQAIAPLLADAACIAAEVIDRLLAKDVISDSVIVESGVCGDKENGQAWTSNVDTWAMSRYAPFSFNGLVVIDGILYGTRDDGVYRISSKGDEVINGKLTTGKLDLGNNGALVHPFSAYLEHELNSGGSATLDVTSTQSGIAETYSYMLTSKPADELTNGRFLFGRGLRGRHFSVSLNISAKHAYINDLRIESAPTKRRV